MERNRKRKEEEEELQSTSYPLPPPASELRNWAELPELALHSILTRLLTSNPDLSDFLSFSSVCRSWKSTSATIPTSFPPLILFSVLYNVNPSRRPRWSCPRRCGLQTLSTRRTFRSKIASETLTLSCLGYSNGRLIFLSDRNPLLVDVFTGELTRIRPPPPLFDDFPNLRLALLADENLLLLTSRFLLFFYRPGTDSWSSLAITDPSRVIKSVAFHRGKLFALDDMSSLMVVDMGGEKVEIFIGDDRNLMEVEAPVEPPILVRMFYNRLVNCGGELLLLRLRMMWLPVQYRITVYALDVERPVWVRKESLGEWCIFLDTVGHCPVACPDPARWGGRSNCVYFASEDQREPNSWDVVPLDEDFFSENVVTSPLHVFSPTHVRRWPIPVWVYPENALLRYK